jgi:hypothetical protein
MIPLVSLIVLTEKYTGHFTEIPMAVYGFQEMESDFPGIVKNGTIV